MKCIDCQWHDYVYGFELCYLNPQIEIVDENMECKLGGSDEEV